MTNRLLPIIVASARNTDCSLQDKTHPEKCRPAAVLGFVHCWTHRPSLASVTPQHMGLPSTYLTPLFRPPHGHPNRDRGHAGFPQSQLYTQPTEACGETFQMGSLHNFQRGVNPAGLLSPSPSSLLLENSCFPKPGGRRPKVPCFVNLPFTQFRSPGGVCSQMFFQGPYGQR